MLDEGVNLPFEIAGLVGCAVTTGVGAVWRTAGVRPGDRVASMIDNSLASMVAWFGSAWVGAEYVTINTRLRGGTLEYILADSAPRIVIADEAHADIMIRLVGDSSETKAALARAVQGLAEQREVIEIPALRLNAVDGIPSTVVAFTTDIPAFNGQWGEPFLIGPGSIHVAHTLEERVAKRELVEAVEIYQRIVRHLCKRSK